MPPSRAIAADSAAPYQRRRRLRLQDASESEPPLRRRCMADTVRFISLLISAYARCFF